VPAYLTTLIEDLERTLGPVVIFHGPLPALGDHHPCYPGEDVFGCTYVARGTQVIELHDDLLADRAELERVLAHELAHGADPRFPDQWRAYQGDTAAEMEAYADALGALIVEHRPRSVKRLAPLAALAWSHPASRAVPSTC
jgi:hypothetical protein